MHVIHITCTQPLTDKSNRNIYWG